MRNFQSEEIKHLEMIQAIITRMAQNSFLLKGWSITLIVALIAFGLDKGASVGIVALLPLLSFWYLDSFFIKTERNYRKLYEQAVDKQVSVFSLIAPNSCTIKQAFFSQTLLVFYGGLFFLILVIYSLKLLK